MLGGVDLSLTLEEVEYQRLLSENQAALQKLAYQVYLQKRPVIIVLEGWNASGKGTAIRRMTERIDPRGFVVYGISAPRGEEASHHYLWRFWRRLPKTGQIAIFDQSWYRRVLVESVEGICIEEQCERAFREINSFERQLVDFGAIPFKFWLHIDKGEQLRRFEARAKIHLHSWSRTAEEWRQHEKWDQYELAANKMLLKTNTTTAPWTIVEANSEYYAHTKILETLKNQLSHELDFDPSLPVEPTKGKKKKKKGKK